MLVELILGLLLAQEADKKAPVKEGAKDGGQGPMLQVAEVDTNADGWISAAELKAALNKLGGGGDGVKKPGAKDGEGAKKFGPKDGEGAPVKKKPAGEGDAPVKKKPLKEGEKGDGERKEGDKEGGEKKAEK
jgi:hypothetical protein